MGTMFAPGALVRVDDREPAGHCRVPLYLRGKVGRVDRLLGTFRDPEKLAYYRDGLPALPLYKVVFSQTEVWPAYAERPGDTVTADIYESWLSPTEG